VEVTALVAARLVPLPFGLDAPLTFGLPVTEACAGEGAPTWEVVFECHVSCPCLRIRRMWWRRASCVGVLVVDLQGDVRAVVNNVRGDDVIVVVLPQKLGTNTSRGIVTAIHHERDSVILVVTEEGVDTH